MLILRDARDRNPLLTGTSLAGALRDALSDRLAGYGEPEPDEVSSLFGGRRGADDGAQSPVIVFDAIGQLPEDYGVEIRDGVAISPRSGTAEEHKKYDYEVLPPGTTFGVRVDLLVPESGRERNLVQALATSLDALTAGEVAIGAKRTRGLGRLTARWSARRFALDSAGGWLAWLETDHENPIGAAAERATALEALQAAAPDALDSLSLLPDRRRRIVFDLDLIVDGEILVRSPAALGSAADVAHLSSAGAPVLPGTSLAGVVRSHALRVARLVRQSQKDADRWIDRLFGQRFEGLRPPFGSEPRASRLRFSDATIESRKSSVRTRIAVDRFTQGVVDGALFAEEVQVGGQARVRLELRNPQPGERGLLLLVLRDLLAGDLAIGGTSAVGRGYVRGSMAVDDGRHRSMAIYPGQHPDGRDADMVEAAIREFIDEPVLQDDRCVTSPDDESEGSS